MITQCQQKHIREEVKFLSRAVCLVCGVSGMVLVTVLYGHRLVADGVPELPIH